MPHHATARAPSWPSGRAENAKARTHRTPAYEQTGSQLRYPHQRAARPTSRPFRRIRTSQHALLPCDRRKRLSQQAGTGSLEPRIAATSAYDREHLPREHGDGKQEALGQSEADRGFQVAAWRHGRCVRPRRGAQEARGRREGGSPTLEILRIQEAISEPRRGRGCHRGLRAARHHRVALLQMRLLPGMAPHIASWEVTTARRSAAPRPNHRRRPSGRAARISTQLRCTDAIPCRRPGNPARPRCIPRRGAVCPAAVGNPLRT